MKHCPIKSPLNSKKASRCREISLEDRSRPSQRRVNVEVSQAKHGLLASKAKRRGMSRASRIFAIALISLSVVSVDSRQHQSTASLSKIQRIRVSSHHPFSSRTGPHRPTCSQSLPRASPHVAACATKRSLQGGARGGKRKAAKATAAGAGVAAAAPMAPPPKATSAAPVGGAPEDGDEDVEEVVAGQTWVPQTWVDQFPSLQLRIDPTTR